MREGLNLIGYHIDHGNYTEAANMLSSAAAQCEALEEIRKSVRRGEHLIGSAPSQDGSQDVLREDAP